MDSETIALWKQGLPAGWGALFDALVRSIHAQDDGATIRDAKQKFGSLRLHLDRYTPATNELIEAAMRQSVRTCERCGMPGTLMVHPNYYYETLCEVHSGDAREVERSDVSSTYRVTPFKPIEEMDWQRHSPRER